MSFALRPRCLLRRTAARKVMLRRVWTGSLECAGCFVYEIVTTRASNVSIRLRKMVEEAVRFGGGFLVGVGLPG